MARTISQIQEQIISAIAANPNLNYVDDNGITRNITYNTSNRAIWRNLTFIVAAAIAVLEQLTDAYVALVESIVSKSAAASALWIQAKMFAFQYDAANPQVIALIGGVPQYPVVDPTLCIVTAASAYTDTTNTVQCKFAIGNPLSAASPPLVAAMQAYLNQIGGAGIAYNAASLSPDLIYVQANIYYNGMYSSSIQANVITALNAWLENLSQTNFDGSLKISDLEAEIRNITGISDVVLQNVYIRRALDAAPTSGPTGFPLVSAYALVNRIYEPYAIPNTAGYYGQETTTGFTFSDSLNFISQ